MPLKLITTRQKETLNNKMTQLNILFTKIKGI